MESKAPKVAPKTNYQKHYHNSQSTKMPSFSKEHPNTRKPSVPNQNLGKFTSTPKAPNEPPKQTQGKEPYTPTKDPFVPGKQIANRIPRESFMPGVQSHNRFPKHNLSPEEQENFVDTRFPRDPQAKQVQRGEIVWCDLGEAVGSEQGGCRPVVVLQNDVGNTYSTTTIVIPLTTKIKKTTLPTHYEFINNEVSQIACAEQIRTVDKVRIGNTLGFVRKEDIEAISGCVHIAVGKLDFVPKQTEPPRFRKKNAPYHKYPNKSYKREGTPGKKNSEHYPSKTTQSSYHKKNHGQTTKK